MKKIAIAIAALSAPLMASNALAYSFIIKNNTDKPVMPFVESLEKDLAVDSVNSWINPGKERIYDLRSSWFTSGPMDVKKGDTRHVEIGDADCGDVTFEGVHSISIDQTEEGLSCSITNVPQVTESSPYVYPVANDKVSYAIADFDNADDQDRPEKYAVGPEKMVWKETGKAGFKQ
ncbi:hypothetical protein [Endozoicomonas sp. Mp262]|uniref:hypothetical protein n=1 Tax=Endozoicomonas sp. Mp262 TaxID=2919499 RepID=UPI0021DFC1CA